MSLDVNYINSLCSSLDNPVFKSKAGYGSDVDFMTRVMFKYQSDCVLVRFNTNSEESTLLVRDEYGILRGRWDTDRIERMFGNVRREIESKLTLFDDLLLDDSNESNEGMSPEEIAILTKMRYYRKTFKSVVKQFSRAGKIKESLKTANQAYDDLVKLHGDKFTAKLINADELDRPAFGLDLLVVGFENGVVKIDGEKVPRLLNKDDALPYNVSVTTGYNWFPPDKDELERSLDGDDLALLGPKWREALNGAFYEGNITLTEGDSDDVESDDYEANGEDLNFLRQQLAFAWRGNPSRRCLFIWGVTGTGKSTIADGAAAAFGGYHKAVQEGLFSKLRDAKAPDPSKAHVMNPFRLCTGGDLLEGRWLDLWDLQECNIR